MCCTFPLLVDYHAAANCYHEKDLYRTQKLANNTRLMDEAVHAANLANRAGYDEYFLNKKLPLPSLAANLKKDLPKLEEQVGTHGDSVLDYTHFSVLYNKSKKLPFYTAVNIHGSTNLMGMVHEERPSDVPVRLVFISGDCFQLELNLPAQIVPACQLAGSFGLLTGLLNAIFY